MEDSIEELEKVLSEKEREAKQIKDKIESIKQKANLPDLVGKYVKVNDKKYIKVDGVSKYHPISNSFSLKGKFVYISRKSIDITYFLSNDDTVIFNDDSMTLIDESEFNEVLEEAIKVMRD